MSTVRNSGSVPFGGRTLEVFDASNVSLGNYRFENINITRATKEITRPTELGEEDNDEWVAVGGAVTGTAELQIALSGSTWPELGSYFVADFGFGNEHFYILNISQPFGMQNYFKANVNLRRGQAPA